MPEHSQNADDVADALAKLENAEGQQDPRQPEEATVNDDPTIVASWMLGVLSQIAAFDDDAVSHLVMGYLKFASGKRLLSVERTAMQISGLARVRGENVELTEEGTALLSALTLSTLAELKVEQEDLTSFQPIKAAPGKREPFALLRFGDLSFEIADADASSDEKVVFRAHGSEDDWLALRNGRENGWETIGAEILTLSIDVFASYINQHVIRLKDDKIGPEAHVFEIAGIRWWVRLNGEDAEFTLNPEMGWMCIPKSIQASSFRDLGIAAAQEFIPDFKKRIDREVRSWVLRMAHAAAISPIMPAVA